MILTFDWQGIFVVHTGRGAAADFEVHAALNLTRHAYFHIGKPI